VLLSPVVVLPDGAGTSAFTIPFALASLGGGYLSLWHFGTL
jgi:hypothetical protein